jgi:hypothetical protein
MRLLAKGEFLLEIRGHGCLLHLFKVSASISIVTITSAVFREKVYAAVALVPSNLLSNSRCDDIV